MSDIPPNSALSRAAQQLVEEHGDAGWRLVEVLRNAEGVATNWGDRDGSILQRVHAPIAAARRGDLPDYYRADAEGVVGSYLAAPLRSSLVDRYLVRLLVEQEFFAYALTQLSPRHAHGVQILRGIRPVGMFFLNLAANVLFLALIGAGLWALVRFTPFPGSWAGGVAALVALWLVAATGYQLVTLPRDWLLNKDARDAVSKILLAQCDAFLSLRADGPISVSRVQEQVNKAADAGTVWPQTLYPLLDDIAGRSTTL